MKIVDMKVTVVGAPWRELTFVELDDRRRSGRARRSAHGQQDRDAGRVLARARRALCHRHAIRSTSSASPGTSSAPSTAAPGEVAQSALSTFDVACWDLMGQSLGVPIYKLLGGRFRERVPAYANGWYQAEREPALIADRWPAVVARGYRALKLDPFGAATPSCSHDERRRSMAIVAAVREAVGPDVEIMLEMHGRFTPGRSFARGRRCSSRTEPAWIEEPVPPENPAALRRVRAATRLPDRDRRAAPCDSQTFREFIETGVRRHRAGGPHALRRFPADEAPGRLGRRLLPAAGAAQRRAGRSATMANVHFAVATPNYKVLEHFNDFADPWVKTLVDAGPEVDRS